MDGASGAGNPELEVRLLGPIEVERGSEPVALGGQKPRAADLLQVSYKTLLQKMRDLRIDD